ncbi:MAG TPA: hypothetical protein VN951_00850 [Pyrinomonadaceae bacterium]|nr:hypothetical protein [Pyrinomonadaceae bacterium]
MNNKLKPALLGGLIVGIFSAVHSLIPIVGVCCCIWSIIGGVVAALIYIKGSPTPVKMGEGAMVGGLAGVVGGIIYVVIYLPIALLWGMATMQEQLNRSGVHLPFSGAILMIVGSIIGAVLLALLATLGGVIGTAIFEKRKGTNAAPPPPQNFGGPSSYGSGV